MSSAHQGYGIIQDGQAQCNKNESAVKFGITALAFIVGLLLFFISKKLMKTIIALFAGLLSAFCALLFLDSFPQICPANMYVILAICGVVSVITVAVFTQCMPATIATLAALAFAMVFHVLFERYIAVPTQYSIYIAANIFFVLIGAIIGAVLGTKYRKVSMKLTGAVMGSFLIVASIGVVIDEFMKGVQTHFNLWEFAVNPQGFVNKCGQITSGGGGTNVYDAFVIMFVAWIVLSVCSLVYQVWLQKSSKVNRERLDTASLEHSV